jgi:hypothetical protein
MDLFIKLFGELLGFICFDRIVIHGYLTGLSRPEHVVQRSCNNQGDLTSADERLPELGEGLRPQSWNPYPMA